MRGNPHPEEQERFRGEANVPILHASPSKEEEERRTEKAAEEAYKQRQLVINESQLKVANSNRNLTTALAVFTLLGVIAGGVQARFASQGIAIADRSAKAAETAAYQACLGAQISRGALLEASRVGIDTHQAALAAIYQGMVATESEAAYIIPSIEPQRIVLGKPAGFIFEFKNGGKSPALDVKAKIRVVIIPRSEDHPEFVYPRGFTTQIDTPQLVEGESPATLKHFNTVFVRGKQPGPLIVTPSLYFDIQTGSKDLILFARINFHDKLGVKHWRTICRTSQSSDDPNAVAGGAAHKGCKDYNKEDSNTILPKPTNYIVPTQGFPDIECLKPTDR